MGKPRRREKFQYGKKKSTNDLDCPTDSSQLPRAACKTPSFKLHSIAREAKVVAIPPSVDCEVTSKTLALECDREADKCKRSSLPFEAKSIKLKTKRKTAEKASTVNNTLLTNSNSESAAKKIKFNFNSAKKIKKSMHSKKIPMIILKKWKQDLYKNQMATCHYTGCKFTGESLIQMKKHHSSCCLTSQKNFICKLCQFQSSFDYDIIRHAFENHFIKNNNKTNHVISDTADFTFKRKRKYKLKVKDKNQCLAEKLISIDSIQLPKNIFKNICESEQNNVILNSFQQTLNFERKNYKLNLFQEYTPNLFTSLNVREVEDYIPELEYSMPIKNTKVDNENIIESEWKTWNRFEGQIVQDAPIFFTGGPVWAMAWLPIPASLKLFEETSEFIAISTHPSMDKEYSVIKSYAGKNIIQIWNVGNLKSDTLKTPELAYAITHDGGTVWCLEWCPSGCYEQDDFSPDTLNKPRKMGLLAAACSDGVIRIYSLVFPECLSKMQKNHGNIGNLENKQNNYPFYDTKPCLILIVNKTIFDGKQTWQVTKLSWTKENGHNIIAAGLSNGYVVLWDLSLKSSLLKSKKDHTIFLKPFKNFLAHHHVVTMVYLVPHGKNRFLATSGLDRMYKLWDLEDVTNPKKCIKKGFITDGSWLDNWFCAFIAGDDALRMNRNFLYCLPVREYTYKYYDMLPMNSTSFSVSTNNYANGIASGTLAGEVLVMFPHQLLNIGNMRKVLHPKRHTSIVSSVEVVDFHEQSNNSKQTNKKINTIYDYMPSNYDKTKDRFGIKFCDKTCHQDMWTTEFQRCEKKTFTCAMMDRVPAEQYPFMSVNRVSWNPNPQSFQWLAVAYQNGFVRCIPFSSLDLKDDFSKL